MLKYYFGHFGRILYSSIIELEYQDLHLAFFRYQSQTDFYFKKPQNISVVVFWSYQSMQYTVHILLLKYSFRLQVCTCTPSDQFSTRLTYRD